MSFGKIITVAAGIIIAGSVVGAVAAATTRKAALIAQARAESAKMAASICQ